MELWIAIAIAAVTFEIRTSSPDSRDPPRNYNIHVSECRYICIFHTNARTSHTRVKSAAARTCGSANLLASMTLLLLLAECRYNTNEFDRFLPVLRTSPEAAAVLMLNVLFVMIFGGGVVHNGVVALSNLCPR